MATPPETVPETLEEEGPAPEVPIYVPPKEIVEPPETAYKDLNILGLARKMVGATDPVSRDLRVNVHADSLGMTRKDLDTAFAQQGFNPAEMMEAIGTRGEDPTKWVEALKATKEGVVARTEGERKTKARGEMVRIVGYERAKKGIGRTIQKTGVIPEELQPKESLEGATRLVFTEDEKSGFFGTDLEDAPEIVKEGSQTHNNSRAINQFLEASDDEQIKRMIHMRDTYKDLEQGAESYILERTADILTAKGFEENVTDPKVWESEKERAAARAAKEIALWKTIGVWQSPSFVRWSSLKGDNEELTWSEAFKPTMEVVGLNANNEVVVRTQGGLQWGLELSDILQSAFTGTLMEDDATIGQRALKGVAKRRHLMEAALESDMAAGGTAGKVAAGGAGFLAAVLFPDLTFGAAGLAKSVSKQAVKRGLVGSARKVAQHQEDAAKLLIEALSSGDPRKLKEAALASGEARKLAPISMDRVDTNDFNVARRLAKDNPDVLGKPGKALAEQLPGEAGELAVNLHPSQRKRYAKKGGPDAPQLDEFAEVPKIAYDELYDYGRHLDLINDGKRLVEAKDYAVYTRWVKRATTEGGTAFLKAAKKLEGSEAFDGITEALRDFRLMAKDGDDWANEVMYRVQAALEDATSAGSMKASQASKIESKLSGIVAKMAKASDEAVENAGSFDDIGKALARADEAVKTNIEARAVALAFERELLLGEIGLKPQPIIAKATTRVRELRELSEEAIGFMDDAVDIFGVSKDQALEVARVMDLAAQAAERKPGGVSPARWWQQRYAGMADKATFMERLGITRKGTWHQTIRHVAAQAETALPEGYKLVGLGDESIEAVAGQVDLLKDRLTKVVAEFGDLTDLDDELFELVSKLTMLSPSKKADNAFVVVKRGELTFNQKVFNEIVNSDAFKAQPTLVKVLDDLLEEKLLVKSPAQWKVINDAGEVIVDAGDDVLDVVEAAVKKLIDAKVIVRSDLDKEIGHPIRVGPIIYGMSIDAVDAAIGGGYRFEWGGAWVDGQMMFRKKGTTRQVPWTTAERDAISRSNNVSFTHNHPNFSWFSTAGGDMSFAAVYDIRDFRVVWPDGTMIKLEAPNGWGDLAYEAAKLKGKSVSISPSLQWRKDLGSYVAGPSSKAANRVRKEAQAAGRTFTQRDWAVAYADEANKRIVELGQRHGVDLRISVRQPNEGIEVGLRTARPTSEGLTGKVARDAAEKKDADVLLQLRDSPAGQARQADLADDVLARGADGHVTAKASPEFIDPAKVMPDPRYARTDGGRLIIMDEAVKAAEQTSKMVDEAFTRITDALREWDPKSVQWGHKLTKISHNLVHAKMALTHGSKHYVNLHGFQIPNVPSAIAYLQSARQTLRRYGAQMPKELHEKILDELQSLDQLMDGHIFASTIGPPKIARRVGEQEIVYTGPAPKLSDVRKLSRELELEIADIRRQRDAVWEGLPDELIESMTGPVYDRASDLDHKLFERANKLERELDIVDLTLDATRGYREEDAARLGIDRLGRDLASAGGKKYFFFGSRGAKLHKGVNDVFKRLGIDEPEQYFELIPPSVRATKEQVLQEVNASPWFHGTAVPDVVGGQATLAQWERTHSGTAAGSMLGHGLYLASNPEVSIRYAGRLYARPADALHTTGLEAKGALKTVDVKVRDVLDLRTDTLPEMLQQLKDSGAKVAVRKIEEFIEAEAKDITKAAWGRARRGTSKRQIKEAKAEILNSWGALETWKALMKPDKLLNDVEFTEDLLKAGIDGVLHHGIKDGDVLVLFDPNANSLRNAQKALQREGRPLPEQLYYQQPTSQQTGWEMKELGDGLVELASKEIRDGGGGLTFKVDGDMLRVQMTELPEALRGQGLGQELYLRALEHAKSLGRGFSSDVSPSPEAIAAYERLIKRGVPLTRKLVEREGKQLRQYVMQADDLADFSLDAVRRAADDVDERILKQEIDDTAKGATEFLDDGRAFIYALENPDFSTLIHEVGHVLRRDLGPEDMGEVHKWVKSLGAKVELDAGRFVGDAAEVRKAEELFAEAFENYIKNGQAPSPGLKAAFQRMKAWMVEIYRTVGPAAKPSPEMVRVFDKLLAETAPVESAMPRVLKLIKRELLGPAAAPKLDVIKTMAADAYRLGVKNADYETLLKQLDTDGKITLEQGIMADRFGKGGKKEFTSQDLVAMRADMENEIADAAASFRPNVATTAYAQAVREMRPTDRIEQLLRGSGGKTRVRQMVKSTFMGGDVTAEQGMQAMAPRMRKNIETATREVQQGAGETIRLVAEAESPEGYDKLIRYLTGDNVDYLVGGRSVLTSGHNSIGSVMHNLSKYFDDGLKSKDALDDLVDMANHTAKGGRLENLGFASELVKRGGQTMTKSQAVERAWKELWKTESGPVFIKDLMLAVSPKVAKGGTPTPQEFAKLTEIVMYYAQKSERNGARFTGTARELTEGLFDDLGKQFGRDSAMRTAVLIGTHGHADRARMLWAGLGLAIDRDTMTFFKRWINGEDVPAQHIAKVKKLVDRFGLNPNFVEDQLLGTPFYIPAAARTRLRQALARGTDPEQINQLMKSEQNIKGITGTVLRYMKLRMTRGGVAVRQRYFLMNTIDHFQQMAMMNGLLPAIGSTMRVVAQDIMVLPGVARTIDVLQRGGVLEPRAAERLRKSLQKYGDKVGRFFSGAKYNVNVNPILEGAEGTFRVGGNVYSYKEIRDIAVQEGIFASFDTSQLSNAVKRAGAALDADVAKNTTGAAAARHGRQVTEFMTQVVTDTAEAWAERERLGGMVTLMEMGVPARQAARMTIDALFDYAGTMSKMDRAWFVSMSLPFWAFQKNANRMIIDAMFSPWGAYRMGVLRRSQERGAELMTTLLYDSVADEYGVDYGSLPEDGPGSKGDYMNLRRVIEDHYGGHDKVPAAERRAIRMWILGQTRTVEDGKFYELDSLLMSFTEGEASPFRDFVQPPPSKAGRPSYLRDRAGVQVPFRMREATREYYSAVFLNKDHPYTEIFIPDSTINAGYRHITNMAAFYILAADGIGLDAGMLSDIDDGSVAIDAMEPLRHVVDLERAPFIGDVMKAYTGKEGYPKRVHPWLVPIVEQTFSTEMLRVPAKEDKFDLPAAPDSVEFEQERVYMFPGKWSIAFDNSPLGELNTMLNQQFRPTDKAPFIEPAMSPLEATSRRGKIVAWARAVTGVQTAEISGTRTAQRETTKRLTTTTRPK